MKSSYRFYTNEAKISYRIDKKDSSKKTQHTNRIGTVVYNILLPVYYNYSKCTCSPCQSKISNCITIGNDSAIVLHNVNIIVYLDCSYMRFCEFMEDSDFDRYCSSEDCINVNIPILFPQEEKHIRFMGYVCDEAYSSKKIAHLNIRAEVLGLNGKMFEIDSARNLYFR